MITIIMICYWQAYDFAKAHHLPDKFKGTRRRRTRGRRKARKNAMRWRKGVGQKRSEGASVGRPWSKDHPSVTA